ncbi:MAG: actin-binding WH2 domain-containing protein [Chloroflexi bacterium]|nr:actin-binding WH2 domain-containing protein [Chloroflexota bacterium]
MNNIFTVIPTFLRHPEKFFQSISKSESIGMKAFSLLVSSIMFLAIYGFVTGLSHSLPQALSSAVKMPVLFVATIFFCLPAFYFFSLVLGTKLSLIQVTTVMLAAIGVTAFLLLGLSPITLFFVLTSDNFPFFRLLAVVFVAMSGGVGIYFLWHGMITIEVDSNASHANLRRLLLGGWFILYAFIGSQMTWRLSPFVNDPTLPFEFIRPTRDNFYIDAARAFVEATGLQISLTNANAVLIGAMCLLPLIALVFGIGMGIDAAKKNKSVPQILTTPQANT